MSDRDIARLILVLCGGVLLISCVPVLLVVGLIVAAG